MAFDNFFAELSNAVHKEVMACVIKYNEHT